MKLFEWLKRRIRLTVAICSVALLSLFSFSYVEDYFEISKNLDIFASLFRELNIYYVDETDPGDLMKKGIDSMLESLDPYTTYIPESEIEDYKFMTTGQYGGIGALIRTRGKYVVITEPYLGFPADKAGLKAGDVIVEIEGQSTENKTSSDISKLLKGQPGTSVKVIIERPGEQEKMEKELVREEIQVDAVPYFGYVEDGIGYVKLSSFTNKAGKDVKNALNKLKEENELRGVVFDLRGNPGGLLRESVNIVNYFVNKGEVIVSTRGKMKSSHKAYKALNSPIVKDIPVAVLVNGNSASASEIVSGALQDLDRGVVIGQTTFGKGLVQTTRPLSYNSRLKVTTAKYYTPSGRCIQAIDYGHKSDDGEAVKIPDSLRTKFNTKNGRTVYDGRGVSPDIEIPKKVFSKVTASLINNNIIFDFATQYRLKNESIAAVKEFRVTDEIFNEFVEYSKDKDYDYKTDSEKQLEELKKVTEKEKYYDNMSSEFDALLAKLEDNKKSDIIKYKQEIKEAIQAEIVTRYYYSKGRIENSLYSDDFVEEAVKILKDKKQYKSVFEVTE